MNLNCWKCANQISEVPAKVGFRATCPFCSADLHCCSNCRFYAPGKPNDCAVPGTEPIRDREAANFCEEFQSRIPSTQKEGRRLFGFEEPKKKKNPLLDEETP